MKNKTISIAKCCYGTLSNALYGLLIMNRDARSVSMLNFRISHADLKDILTHAKEINEYGKDDFVIDNFNIEIKENMLNGVKPFLLREFIRIIAPQNDILTQADVVFLDDMLWLDPSPEFDVDEAKTNKYYKFYVKRFITRESYSAETLRTFDVLANELSDLKITVPSPAACITASIFRALIGKNRFEWRKLLSDLLNGALGADEDVTDYFPRESGIVSHAEWINDHEAASPLIYEKDGRIMTAPAFFDDKTTVLPYIVPFLEFSYLPPGIADVLIVLSRR